MTASRYSEPETVEVRYDADHGRTPLSFQPKPMLMVELLKINQKKGCRLGRL